MERQVSQISTNFGNSFLLKIGATPVTNKILEQNSQETRAKRAKRANRATRATTTDNANVANGVKGKPELNGVNERINLEGLTNTETRHVLNF